MKISTTAPTDLLAARALPAANAAPQPPQKWARWWTSPIARVDYAAGTQVQTWREAWIPADRGLTGSLQPAVTYGGSTREAAIEAARLLASKPISIDVDLRDGTTRNIVMHPAIAVLRDTRAGAFWLAPLRTTVRSNGEWVDAPHSIDGAAFEGAEPLMRSARVLSATADMVAVVGRDRVDAPGRWRSAPADSRVR